MGEAQGPARYHDFEGRDAAGKGGTIKAITERVSPRVFRVVALPAPSDREKIADVHPAVHAALPGGGRDRDLRSQLVQPRRRRVRHGLLHEGAAPALSRALPEFEKYIVDGGIQLIKIWLEVSDKEQKRRFEARIKDPAAAVEAQPDGPAVAQPWFDYSRARDMMLKATDTKHAPWYILRSDDKKRARLNCIAHILNLIPYKKVPRAKVKLPKRSMKGAYDDRRSLQGRKFVKERY